MSNKVAIVNPEDVHIWDKLFKVSLANVGGELMYVFANCDSEAIDAYADHAMEQGWVGYFLDEEDVADFTDENNEEIDICRVGNGSWPVHSWEVHCREVTGWEKTRIKKEADGYGY